LRVAVATAVLAGGVACTAATAAFYCAIVSSALANAALAAPFAMFVADAAIGFFSSVKWVKGLISAIWSLFPIHTG
jgi:hypothetical protein